MVVMEKIIVIVIISTLTRGVILVLDVNLVKQWFGMIAIVTRIGQVLCALQIAVLRDTMFMMVVEIDIGVLQRRRAVQVRTQIRQHYHSRLVALRLI